MRLLLFVVSGLIIGLISCNKDNSIITDYRDIVTGDYNGIRVNTYWIDTITGFGHDTSHITLTLEKSELDSIIDISFNPDYPNEDFSFKLVDGEFVSTTYYHPPILKLTDDSLYYRHQAGLGPIWTECFTKKIQ